MNETFISSKVYDGFSVCFRQYRAEDTHCKFLHGYGIYFKVWFEGHLDERNWVFDFGRLKRTKTTIDGMNPKEWMEYLLDHTVLISESDPELSAFLDLHEKGVIQLRILNEVGMEPLCRHLFEKLYDFVARDTNGRVEVKKVELFEHWKNSVIYPSK